MHYGRDAVMCVAHSLRLCTSRTIPDARHCPSFGRNAQAAASAGLTRCPKLLVCWRICGHCVICCALVGHASCSRQPQHPQLRLRTIRCALEPPPPPFRGAAHVDLHTLHAPRLGHRDRDLAAQASWEARAAARWCNRGVYMSAPMLAFWCLLWQGVCLHQSALAAIACFGEARMFASLCCGAPGLANSVPFV